MMIEGRDEEGFPSWDMACSVCGVMFEPGGTRSGMDLASQALGKGWGWLEGVWYCEDDSIGEWEGPKINMTPPPGYTAPKIRKLT